MADAGGQNNIDSIKHVDLFIALMILLAELFQAYNGEDDHQKATEDDHQKGESDSWFSTHSTPFFIGFLHSYCC